MIDFLSSLPNKLTRIVVASIASFAFCSAIASANALTTPSSNDNTKETAIVSKAETAFTLGGFTEAVFIVSNLQQSQTFFERVAGYEVKDDSPVDDKLKLLWQLPDSAQLSQRLMGNIGEERGYVRLVHLAGVEQQRIRSSTQSWDTGGIFDVNVRVKDMNKKFKALQALGWNAVSDPIEFSFGPFVVKEWIVTGPDGISIALIERVKPELVDWPNLKEFSRLFNSTQVVKDITTSTHFYRHVLGFKPYLEHKGASKTPSANVLGLPYNMATQVERSVDILHPDGINEGSVELLQFHGAEGKDVSALARPPHLGIATLRFPVSNLTALKNKLTINQIKIVAEQQINLPPYGLVDMLSIITPDGNWLEFYHQK